MMSSRSRPRALLVDLVLRVVFLDHKIKQSGGEIKHQNDNDDENDDPSDSFNIAEEAEEDQKYLPDKILLTLPSVLTFSELTLRLRGQFRLKHEVSFVFNGLAFKPEDFLPHDCFESLQPLSDDFDYYRPRLVMCVALDCPVAIADEAEELSESILSSESEEDELASADEEEIRRERQRAGRCWDVAPMVDLEGELGAIGCTPYMEMLQQAGFMEEGVFSCLTEELLASTKGVCIPFKARERILELAERVRERLRQAEEKPEASPVSRPTSQQKKGRETAQITPEDMSRAKDIAPWIRMKIGEIERRIKLQNTIYNEDKPGDTEENEQYLKWRLSLRSHPPCCTPHAQHVEEKKHSIRTHNKRCFAAELEAELSWLYSSFEDICSLESMVEVSLHVIRRGGWKSMTKDKLLEDLSELCELDKEEVEELEKFFIHRDSVREDRSVLMGRQYSRRKFIKALVEYLDQVNSDFFYSYSIT